MFGHKSFVLFYGLYLRLKRGVFDQHIPAFAVRSKYRTREFKSPLSGTKHREAVVYG